MIYTTHCTYLFGQLSYTVTQEPANNERIASCRKLTEYQLFSFG